MKAKQWFVRNNELPKIIYAVHEPKDSADAFYWDGPFRTFGLAKKTLLKDLRNQARGVRKSIRRIHKTKEKSVKRAHAG